MHTDLRVLKEQLKKQKQLEYLATLETANQRDLLLAARTYYVRTDGDDSSNGLTDTPTGAFATLEHAVNVVCDELDLGPYNVTIQLGNGTHTLNGQLYLRSIVGTGLPSIIGNTVTPSSVIVLQTVVGIGGIVLATHAVWFLDGFKLRKA